MMCTPFALHSADLGVLWQRSVTGRGRVARALMESSRLSPGRWFPSLNGGSTFSCLYQKSVVALAMSRALLEKLSHPPVVVVSFQVCLSALAGFVAC